MRTDELTGIALDYWCARALVDDEEEVRFVAMEPALVVTLTHGETRKLDQRFAPASGWADAADVLERARELRLTAGEDGSAMCSARFEGCPGLGEASASSPRLALLRAFVRARFGEEVDDYPKMPHAVHRGVVMPIESGEQMPTYAEDRARIEDETGDIRSVPRP